LVFQLLALCLGKNQMCLLCGWLFFQLAYNGCVYETFGISKRKSIKLQLLLIRAETLDKPLTAKCFIHVVVHWCSVFPVIFLSICYFVSVCRALGQTHSLTSFGFSVGSWGLAMCVAVKRGHSLIHCLVLLLLKYCHSLQDKV